MITYWKNAKATGELTRVEKITQGVWVEVEDPNQEDFELLTEKFNLDPELLRDAIDPDEIPRYDHEDNDEDYIFLRQIVRNSNGAIRTEPLLVVITKKAIVTISRGGCEPIKKALQGKKAVKTDEHEWFLVRIVEEITLMYERANTNLGKQIRNIQNRVKVDTVQNRDFVLFINLVESYDDIVSTLVPQNILLRRLIMGKHIGFDEDQQVAIKDIIVDNEQVIEVSKSNLKTISNLRESYANIMGNNLNRVIRLLTILTVVLTVPTFMASLYGMNVPLPGKDSPDAFWFIIASSLILSTILFIVFDKLSNRIR